MSELEKEMLEEFEFLIEHCIKTETRESLDGVKYEVELISAGPSSVARIRELIAKAKGQSNTKMY